jgi:hypothetical protein
VHFHTGKFFASDDSVSIKNYRKTKLTEQELKAVREGRRVKKKWHKKSALREQH